LPAGLDLAAYRIVQEALTNAGRHSGATRVGVRLRYRPDDLEIEVNDNGRGAGVGIPTGAGHGLVGMRERAALYGGRLDIATAPSTGFTVRAVLPAWTAVT